MSHTAHRSRALVAAAMAPRKASVRPAYLDEPLMRSSNWALELMDKMDKPEAIPTHE